MCLVGQPCTCLQTLLWQQLPELHRDMAVCDAVLQCTGTQRCWPQCVMACSLASKAGLCSGPQAGSLPPSCGASEGAYAVCIHQIGQKHQHILGGHISCKLISLQQTTQGGPAGLHAQCLSSTLVLLLAAGSSMLTDDVPTAPAPGREAVVNAIQQLNAAPQLELFGADIDVMADTDEEEEDKKENEDQKNDGKVNAAAHAT